jgi:DNA-binding NarL/FixJ family response regulator
VITDLPALPEQPRRARWQPPVPAEQPREVLLTPMLASVLESLCEGKSNKAIGHDWGIAEDTVKTHLRRLYARTGARDRCHLISLVYSRMLLVDVGRAPRTRS